MSMDLNWKNKAEDEEAEAEETFVVIKAALEVLEEIETEEAEAELNLMRKATIHAKANSNRAIGKRSWDQNQQASTNEKDNLK